MSKVWILAESNKPPSGVTATPVVTEETSTKTAADSNASAPVTTQPRTGLGGTFWFYILLMFILMYFILFRGPQKQKQERKRMMQSLQKNDRVQTIGGIIGTIVDIKDDEITLKVDESNNTKIKVIPSAIGRNLSHDKK